LIQIYLLSLDRALDGIGADIEVPDDIARRADYVLTWRYSQAAANLHQILHNVPEERPKWLMPHPVTRRPVATEAAAAEGMAVLEEVSGWFSRHHQSTGSFGVKRDREALDMDALVKSTYFTKFRSGKLGREHAVGFDRTELIRYLDSPRVDMPHRIYGGQTLEYIKQLEARRRGPVLDAVPVGGATSPKSPVDTPSTEKRIAPRLALPEKADTWAKAIEATYETMVKEAGAAPGGQEVWLRLNHQPPANYPVTAAKDHGLPAIALTGEKPLTRDGFNKRWRRYTNAT